MERVEEIRSVEEGASALLTTETGSEQRRIAAEMDGFRQLCCEVIGRLVKYAGKLRAISVSFYAFFSSNFHHVF